MIRRLRLLFFLPLVAGCDETTAETATTIAKTATEYLLPPLMIVVAGVVPLLGRALIRWLAHRTGTEELAARLQLDELVVRQVDKAIAMAEQRGLQWAKTHGELPGGARKLGWALDFLVHTLAEQGIPEMARDHLVELIEARLGTPDAPGEADEARDVVLQLRSAPRAGSLLALLVAVPLLGACGSSQTALSRSTTALGTWSAAHAGVVDILRGEVEADLRDHCSGAEDVSACVDARAERWRALEDAVDVAAAAQDAAELAVYRWAQRVDAGEADPERPPALTCRLIERSVTASAAVVRLARELGTPIAPSIGELTWAC